MGVRSGSFSEFQSKFGSHECFQRNPKCTIIITGCDCHPREFTIDTLMQVVGVQIFTCPFCGMSVAKFCSRKGSKECPHSAVIEARLRAGWNPYNDFTLQQLRAARQGRLVTDNNL